MYGFLSWRKRTKGDKRDIGAIKKCTDEKSLEAPSLLLKPPFPGCFFFPFSFFGVAVLHTHPHTIGVINWIFVEFGD